MRFIEVLVLGLSKFKAGGRVLVSRDLNENTLEIFRRDTLEKKNLKSSEVIAEIKFLIEDIQESLLKKSKAIK